MNNNKLAVIFPGIGYHSDKPLLYYSKKVAKRLGYEILDIRYDIPTNAGDIKNNQSKMQEVFELAVRQAREQLSSIDIKCYDRVVFIGKSIGTAVAAKIVLEDEVGAEQVVFTPVPQTFEHIGEGKNIVFHGTADPWCDTTLVDEKCAVLGLGLYKYENANHSIETGAVIKDIDNIRKIMEKVECFLK